MPLDFSALETTIGELETVVGSADALMDALFAEVEANKNNPAALQALVDRGRVAKDALAASVVENTPSAPEPPPA